MSLSLKKGRVQKIVSQFPKKKILVFGDVGVDKYTIGKVSRISPEAPIPIVEVVRTESKLGLAANVADNIASLTGKAYLMGVIGKDLGADELLGLIRQRKIFDRYMVIDRTRKTTVKERVVAESQQVVRIDHETQKKVDLKLVQEIWKKAELALKEVDALIIEDYAKGLVEASLCAQLIQRANHLDVPVFVDPNRNSPAALYSGCTLMTPNTSEAEALTGIAINDGKSLRNAGQRLLDVTSAKVVIITRGKEGMAIFQKDKAEPVLIPTFAREVFDVSGAGDTAIATLALSLVSGASLIESALLANFAAGVVVGKRGTATVTIAEVKEYIDFVGKYGRDRAF